MTTHKVAILEPLKLFRDGFSTCFSLDNEFTTICLASSVEGLIQSLTCSKSEIIIVDMLHFSDAGLRELKKIRQHFSDIPFLLITREDFSEYFHDYLTLGVKGFVFEGDGLDELFGAVKKVLKGKMHIPKGMVKFLQKQVRRNDKNKFTDYKNRTLTEREISVLKLFCDGLTFKEVGKKLFISPRTVEAHKRNIFEKLNIRSSVEMVKYAAQHKYTSVYF
jgi:DNA-binding NarL/FixJ family response regulator